MRYVNYVSHPVKPRFVTVSDLDSPTILRNRLDNLLKLSVAHVRQNLVAQNRAGRKSSPEKIMSDRSRFKMVIAILVALCAFPGAALAHNVSGRDASFVESLNGPAIVPFIYLGAKHMVTGYDHLAFLVGVVFFLYRLKDVALYVSLFTLGHSITLLSGVLFGIRANPFAIDAIIGLSVVYKAFENMGGFERVFGFQPNTRVAVLVFGLFHGFGLATKLQDLSLSKEGLVANIVSFNVGVEIGQVLALTAVVILLGWLRTRGNFARNAFATNTALMAVGFILIGYQVAGYFESA
jgi:hypothetical protein